MAEIISFPNASEPQPAHEPHVLRVIVDKPQGHHLFWTVITLISLGVIIGLLVV